MRRKNVWLSGLPALWIIIALGCGETPPMGVEPDGTSPQGPASSLTRTLTGTVGTLASQARLLTCSPLPYDSVAVTIGPRGGALHVGPHRLVVPAGALAAPVVITAVAPVRAVNVVRLGPDGLSFAIPATLTMSYQNCNLLGSLLPVRIAQVSDDLQILGYLESVITLPGVLVTAPLPHFSNYAVAW